MPPSVVLPLAAALVILALLSAFISALETGFFALPRSRLEALRAQRGDLGEGLSQILEKPRRLVSAILIADALVNAPLMIGSLALIEGQRGVDIPFWASALLIFALIVFACDLVPKLIGLGAPMLVVRFGTRLLGRLLPVADPLSRLLERGSERVAEAILPESMRTPQQLTDEELGTLVEMSAAQGALQETETEMISEEIIKLGDKTAKDCMTPRVEMFSLPDDLTNDEVIRLVRQRRLRRVPVHGETPDDIEGVLDVPSLLRDPDVHYTERLDVPSYVPETMKVLALLKGFLSHPQGIAFVVDEHGGVEGIVTLRDLVEEIIGDAMPPTDAKLYIEELGVGRVLASGAARLEDITETIDVPFEDEGVGTIGGLIFTRLGQLPKKGQVLQIASLKVTVRRVSRKRVDEVLIERGDGKERAGVIWIFVIAVCLLVSFVFSGIEAGIFSVNRVRLAHRAKLRDPAALTLQRLLENPDRMLVTVLFVTHLANIFSLVIGTGMIVSAMGRGGYLVALAIYFPLYLFALEMLPKSLFRRFPYRALAFLSGPLRLLDTLFTPVHWLGIGAQRLLFGKRTAEQQRLFLGREDFKYITAESERTGTISTTERKMIDNVVDFRVLVARDLMTPILPSEVIHDSEPISRLLSSDLRRGPVRWLVCDGDETVTGFVDAFEVLLEGRRDLNAGACQRRIVTVGAGEPAFSVLWKMRAARSTVAVVRGPGTRPSGRVSWEDLIRRLVSVAESRDPGVAKPVQP